MPYIVMSLLMLLAHAGEVFFTPPAERATTLEAYRLSPRPSAGARRLGLVEFRLIGRAGQTLAEVFAGPDEVSFERRRVRFAPSVRRRIEDVLWLRQTALADVTTLIFVAAEDAPREGGFPLARKRLDGLLARVGPRCRSWLW